MKIYEVNITDEANEDLDSIYDYIISASKNLEVADNFVKELYDYVKNSLSYFPERNPVYKKNIRKAIYPKNTNYLVFYEISEKTNEIFILVVTNAKQYTRYKNL